LRDASGSRKASAATITAILERVFIRSITSVELDQPLQGKDGVKPYVGVKHGGGEFVAGFEGKVGEEVTGGAGRGRIWEAEGDGLGWNGTCTKTCKS
jgi:hypothetical protein